MTADPFRSYNFRVRLGGEEVAGFAEAEGMGGEVETVAYREGGEGKGVRHLPGGMKTRPVTLKRGVARGDGLLRWFQSTSAGEVELRDVEIALKDEAGRDAVIWRLHAAWVTSFRAGALDAESGEMTLEAVTLAFDRVERG